MQTATAELVWSYCLSFFIDSLRCIRDSFKTTLFIKKGPGRDPLLNSHVLIGDALF